MYSGIFKADHLIGDFESGKSPYPDSVKLLYNFLSNEELENVVKTELKLPLTSTRKFVQPEADPSDPTSDW